MYTDHQTIRSFVLILISLLVCLFDRVFILTNINENIFERISYVNVDRMIYTTRLAKITKIHWQRRQRFDSTRETSLALFSQGCSERNSPARNMYLLHNVVHASVRACLRFVMKSIVRKRRRCSCSGKGCKMRLRCSNCNQHIRWLITYFLFAVLDWSLHNLAAGSWQSRERIGPRFYRV